MPWLRGKGRIEPCAPYDVNDIETGQQEARHDGAGVETHDRHARRGGIDDQHDAGRDQNAEAATRADDAGGEGRIITGFQHCRKCQQAHQRYDGANDAGCGCEQGARNQCRDCHRARQAARHHLQHSKEPVDQIGAFNDIAHEEEQRDGDENVIGHHGIGLIDKQIEDSVVKQARHPFCVVIGVVAEEHRHAHQSEADRKSQKDGEHKQAQHHHGDFGIAH